MAAKWITGVYTAAFIAASLLPPQASAKEASATARERIAQSRDAAMILRGKVRSITREGESMLITFHVDDPVRGVFANDNLTLGEWVGLWREDRSRFVVGESGYYFLRTGAPGEFGSLMQRFPIQAGRVMLVPAPLILSSRAKRLHTSPPPVTMTAEDFAALLRVTLAQAK